MERPHRVAPPISTPTEGRPEPCEGGRAAFDVLRPACAPLDGHSTRHAPDRRGHGGNVGGYAAALTVWVIDTGDDARRTAARLTLGRHASLRPEARPITLDAARPARRRPPAPTDGLAPAARPSPSPPAPAHAHPPGPVRGPRGVLSNTHSRTFGPKFFGVALTAGTPWLSTASCGCSCGLSRWLLSRGGLSPRSSSCLGLVFLPPSLALSWVALRISCSRLTVVARADWAPSPPS